MPKASQPTVVGRGLGGELRELREARKLPLRRVAIRLGWQPSKLSRMETGIQGIQAADVASLLVIYGVTGDERKRLLGMAERSAESGWWEAIGGPVRRVPDADPLGVRGDQHRELAAAAGAGPAAVPGLHPGVDAQWWHPG